MFLSVNGAGGYGNTRISTNMRKLKLLTPFQQQRNLKKYKALARQYGHFNTVSQTGFTLYCLDCRIDIGLDQLDPDGGPVRACGEKQWVYEESRGGWEDSKEQQERRDKGLCDLGQYVDENGYFRTSNNPGS
jgi:hypothetical protein